MDAGETVDHDLTLVPGHDGIYTVLATVTTGSADAAVSRSFVIPIVVGTRRGSLAKPKLAAQNRDPITRRPRARIL